MDVLPAWLDEIDPVVGPPFLRMGTRALARGQRPAAAAETDADTAALIAAKARLLAERHAEVFACLPEADRASGEIRQRVEDEHVAVGTPRTDLHPLDAAGRVVPEDLCVLVPRDGGWILAGASLCFPSHWRLHDKLGRSVAAIHGPVPAYAEELEVRVDRFLDKLRPGAPVWRRNWTVHASPALFAPDVPPPPHPPVTAEDAGDRLWLRSEHQTLERLPATGAILFAIRTQQIPLAPLARRPDLCARFAAAAESWSGELLAYRGGEAIRRPLVAWLRTSAASGTGGSPSPRTG